ncbi:right-handed parallel beta-helix repeat-containing protein [Flavivirga abyssicola]|uniref:right-handed parallel beta-helix repeat-containing protein n=1 Tax=Flavivirga abyssicola TaxID=3063533 RepID=UPI0026DF276A|nr:right-handed parallel beta-helix repeat-containing protein [Flavivirga sp. MEBiC07777]WVK12990.1 right-handed parallel beta-helix repeat-containing protein [Flavivirga sp. MEBiC07777]
MKEILKHALFILLLTLSLTACNNEELFVEVAEVVEDEKPIDNEDTPPDDTDPGNTDTTLPCDFTLDNVTPNSTIIINCIMDLDGKTVNLPSNVTIQYEGGDIINGTLNFGDNGIIGGELLNFTLNIVGANPQVKDPIFHFDPKRWGIVEGKVSDGIAKKNKDILNELMIQSKDLGVTTFKIDEIDAYFKVEGDASNAMPVLQAVKIPSDFNFIMTDNTHLRVQPNDYPYSTLLSVHLGSNILIEGGNLHGDRDEHDYSQYPVHDWGHLLTIRGGNSVLVKNVTMMDAMGDGLDIQGEGHAVNPDYRPTKDLLVTGCKFIRNRRNNVSITAVDGMTIEDSDFIDASINTSKSQGTAPGWGLDIEALKPNELAENIILRNNRERGSRKGAFIVAIGDRVTIEGNTLENPIVLQSATECVVRNNDLVAKSDIMKSNGSGIITGRADRGSAVHSNDVYDNTVTDFSTGISVSNSNMKVYGNTINNCGRGIAVGGVAGIENSEVYGNTIKSNADRSAGISMAAEINNVIVRDNNVDVVRFGVVFQNVNSTAESANYLLEFKGNTILGGNTTTMTTSNNIDLIENSFNRNFEFYTCSNINIIGNTITSNSKPPLYLRTDNSNIALRGNIMSAPQNVECIDVLEGSGNDNNSIVMENNTCN